MNTQLKEYRVDSLPTSGLVAGDIYQLDVGGGKFKTFIVNDSLEFVIEAGAEFIEKDTMSEMRALTGREIWAIENGYYKGVRLNGYYQKGDTPTPIEYYISNTTEDDDGGSVIEVNGVKLEHVFTNTLDLSHYGIVNTSTGDQTALIQKVINKGAQLSLRVTSFAGKYYINGRHNIGGRGLVIPSNSNIDFDKNAVFEVLPQNSGSYTAFSIVSSENIKISSLNIIGDRYHHPAPNGYWIMWKPSTNVNVNDYIYINGWGLRVSVAGITGATKPILNSSVTIDSTITNGTATFIVTNSGIISGSTLGEWGMGLSILSSKDIYIDTINAENLWGDGIYLGKTGAIPTNENININYVNLKDVRRQGVSVITVNGLNINTVKIDTVIGAEPEAGIDFEPNNSNEPINGVRIRKIDCRNSLDAAVLFVFAHLDETTDPIDIKIGEIVDNDCRSAVRIGYNDNLENSKKKGLVIIDTIKSTRALAHVIDSPNFQFGVDFTFGDIYIEDCNQWGNVDPFGSGIRIYKDSRFAWKPNAISPVYTINNVYSKSSDGKMNKIINVYEYGENVLSIPRIDLRILGEIIGDGTNAENSKYRIKSSGNINYKGLRNKLNTGENISLTSNTVSKIDNADIDVQTLFSVNNMPIGWELTVEVKKDVRIGIQASNNFKLFRFQDLESKPLTSAVAGSSIVITHVGSNVWDIKELIGRWYYGVEMLRNVIVDATANDLGIIQIASQTEVNNGINTVKAVTPSTLSAKHATLTSKGLVNQSAASADLALPPSTTYTQSEVQAILTELRDLKAKLRAAGILAN